MVERKKDGADMSPFMTFKATLHSKTSDLLFMPPLENHRLSNSGLQLKSSLSIVSATNLGPIHAASSAAMHIRVPGSDMSPSSQITRSCKDHYCWTIECEEWRHTYL